MAIWKVIQSPIVSVLLLNAALPGPGEKRLYLSSYLWKVESNQQREYFTNYVFITVSLSKLRTLLSTEVEFFWNESPPVKNKLNPQIHWINFKLETKFRKYNSSKARNMKSVRSFYDPAPTIFILLHFIDLDIDCLFGENTVHYTTVYISWRQQKDIKTFYFSG